MQRWAARLGLHAGLHGCAAQRLPSLTAWIIGTSTLHALYKAMCGLSVSISDDIRFWYVLVVRRRFGKGVCVFRWVSSVLCVLCGAGVLFVRLRVYRSSVVLATYLLRFCGSVLRVLSLCGCGCIAASVVLAAYLLRFCGFCSAGGLGIHTD